ncbi:GGDEF domain-containing protein [Halopseudomonas maritima]|uniref:GGDEF domain-containing protein n=1 Tax=Halopseudomonas maritima TaxID=2918528 RepID=UPI001EE9B493|nr:GGDEF domain-containing protein [Halopseudomonas maritima]
MSGKSPMDEAAGNGLGEQARRSLLQLIFVATGVLLWGFASLQFDNNNSLLACLEITVGGVLLVSAWRIRRVRSLTPWIYAYLLPTFCFQIYIMLMPDASTTAFVWIYMVPMLAYLLLGRKAGLLLSLPFMLLAVVLYGSRYADLQSAPGLIDLGNAVICGLMILLFVHFYEVRRANAQHTLERLAETDALTGVYNRGRFQQLFEQCIEQGQRSGDGFALVLLDVDHFKQVNDGWGHEVGDRALRHLCTVLQRRLRKTDVIGRLGGEEFGLLLRSTDAQAAEQLARMFCSQLQQTPLRWGDQQELLLTATFGVAHWPTDALDAADLYRRADQRLYRGKAYGRNRVISEGGALQFSELG